MIFWQSFKFGTVVENNYVTKRKNYTMNIIKIGLIAILSTLLFISSCTTDSCIGGEGDQTNKTLNINNFSGINMGISSNVFIVQGTEQQVIATGHGNVIERVSTSVVNGIWNIELEDGCYDNYDLRFYVVVPNLHDVIISGSGDVTIGDFMNQSNLDIDISGSGDVFMDGFISLGDLDINISGSGDVMCHNTASTFQTLDILITGSGEYYGFDNYLKNCYISIPGSGSCQVQVQSKLDVDISGSGSVYYKGYPAITTNISGSGNVINSN